MDRIDAGGDNKQNGPRKPTIHVEICQQPPSIEDPSKIEQAVSTHVLQLGVLKTDMYIENFAMSAVSPYLAKHVKSIQICNVNQVLLKMGYIDSVKGIDLINGCCLKYHVYRLNDEGVVRLSIPGSGNEEDNDLESACMQLTLPSKELEGMWENLVYDVEIKQNLLNIVNTSLLFAAKGIRSNVISFNRMVLLHGPSGTGKTSLCRALAHKLCIRLSKQFKYGQLVEINSHSLFSKWFSQSGKSVLRIFEAIEALLSDPNGFVILLIDEVESLAHTRQVSSCEPSDAIRVVNALLTQIDAIKRYPNVLILTTSNVTEAIDPAFIDRADITQYIGLPSPSAIYQILDSCLTELGRAKMIRLDTELTPLETETIEEMCGDVPSINLRVRLSQISKKAEGLSGRTLRKLPFLAYSHCIEETQVELETFLTALTTVIEKKIADKEDMDQ